MRQSDISFALTAVLQAMSPGAALGPGPPGGDIRAPSLTFSAAGRDAKRAVRIPVSLYRVAFLGKKITSNIITIYETIDSLIGRMLS